MGFLRKEKLENLGKTEKPCYIWFLYGYKRLLLIAYYNIIATVES